MTVYGVRVSGAIEARGKGWDRRRRGGVEFGPVEKLVSVDAVKGALRVKGSQLALILADEHLRVRKLSAAAQEPPVVAEPAPAEPEAPAAEAAPEPVAEPAPDKPTGTRRRYTRKES